VHKIPVEHESEYKLRLIVGSLFYNKALLKGSFCLFLNGTMRFSSWIKDSHLQLD